MLAGHQFTTRLAPPNANPMVVLRTALSSTGMFDPDGGINTEEANLRKGRRILAQVATIVSSLHRIRLGNPLLSADAKMGFAANFLYMLRGKLPEETESPAGSKSSFLLLNQIGAATFQ